MQLRPWLLCCAMGAGGPAFAVDCPDAQPQATVSISGSSGPNINRSNAGLAGTYDTGKRWKQELALTWSLPLSDGGARQSRTAQGLAALDAALATQATLERSVREALWLQWTAWRGADADVNAARAALAAAQEAESAQRGRYQAGAGTLADWINAQSDLSARMRQAANAEQARVRAAVGTAHALGRLTLESP